MKDMVLRVTRAVLITAVLLSVSAGVSSCAAKKSGADDRPVLPEWHATDAQVADNTDIDKAATPNLPEIAEPKKPEMPKPPTTT